jgi:hypothetical protein
LPAAALSTSVIAAPKRGGRKRQVNRRQGGRRQASSNRTVRSQAAAARYRVVTRSFANAQAIAIPASGADNPYPSPIPVSGFVSGRIEKVTVTLNNFSHTYPSDVDAMLVGPNGRAALIMSDLGGTTPVSGLVLTFDDQALGQPPSPLVSGTYQPTNHDFPDAFPAPAPGGMTGHSLAVFNGSNPNGSWQLYVVDDVAPDAGSIAGGRSLTIRAKVRVPRPRGRSQGNGGQGPRANCRQQPRRGAR